ncbi:MAG: hypothetical protein FWF56_06330 [Firmicutes bacterium]|nr:hypothetical protein [Bacillota bacterium]MCL1953958.1 hypothetical protein [Bacillota bacterium]
MSEGSKKITIAHVAVVVVFILAISITLSALFGIFNWNPNFLQILRQISLTIATTLALIASFERIKKFKKQGWQIAYIIACIIVVVFLVIEFVNIFKSL